MSNRTHKDWDIFYGGSAKPMLSLQECKDLTDKVHSLKKLWVEREVVKNHPIKFHTLGGATYLDLDKKAYAEHKESSSDIMHREFSSLYYSLCRGVQEVVGYRVIIAEDLAPPGFHIYQGNPASGVGLHFGGKVHIDAPHLEHKDKFDSIDGVLSLTLALCLPQDTGGMYYWTGDVPPDVYGFTFEKTPEQYAWLEANKKRVDYKLGEAALHEGNTAHQLANLCTSDVSDWRITLQAHGILCGDLWHLYF